MTKEQSIEILEKLDYLLDDVYSTGLVEDEERNKYQDAIETVLSMLEEKDKQIDLMAEYIESKKILVDKYCYALTKETIKQYFVNKVKELLNK